LSRKKLEDNACLVDTLRSEQILECGRVSVRPQHIAIEDGNILLWIASIQLVKALRPVAIGSRCRFGYFA
jgi:hypothetical protein